MIDLSPDPTAAPATRRIWAHALMETKLILSNGEQLILAILFPLSVLIAGRFLGERLGADFAVLTPSVLAMVLWSSGLTTLAISTGFERRYNVLERLAATPLGREGLLVGKGLAIGLITLGQTVLVAITGLFLGWRPVFSLPATAAACLIALVALGVYIALGLALAGSLRPETTLAVANLLYLFGLPLGIVVPVSALPSWAHFVWLLPTAATGEALRFAGAGQSLWWPLAVNGVWLLVAAALARKVFRWTS